MQCAQCARVAFASILLLAWCFFEFCFRDKTAVADARIGEWHCHSDFTLAECISSVASMCSSARAGVVFVLLLATSEVFFECSNDETADAIGV